MATPDPALGFDVDFDDDEFKSAIHFAMEMGLNPDPDRRPIFVRKGVGATYWKDNVQLLAVPRLDADRKPMDPNIEVRRTADERVTDVDCAVEIVRADAEELPVGNFRPTKAVVTLLDDEYAQISDCRELVYNGDRYLYGYEPESQGLFETGVYVVIYYALDES